MILYIFYYLVFWWNNKIPTHKSRNFKYVILFFSQNRLVMFV